MLDHPDHGVFQHQERCLGIFLRFQEQGLSHLLLCAIPKYSLQIMTLTMPCRSECSKLNLSRGYCSTRVTKNAVSLSKRLKTAQSMKLVLFEELSLMEKARSETLAELAKLAEATSQLQPGFVEQVTRGSFSINFGRPCTSLSAVHHHCIPVW